MATLSARTFYEAILTGNLTEDVYAYAEHQLQLMETRVRRAHFKQYHKNWRTNDEILQVLAEGEKFEWELVAALDYSLTSLRPILRLLEEQNKIIRTEAVARGRSLVKYTLPEKDEG